MFKDIPGYEGLYEISDEGVVRSKDRVVYRMNMGKVRPHFKKGKELTPDKHKINGRQRVRLYDINGISRRFQVHRLVLETFVGPCPEGKMGCHKDDNHTNNSIDNLYWGTSKENGEDFTRNGKSKLGSSNGNSKLKDEEVWLIKKLLYNKVKQNLIAKMFKVSPTMILYIKQNKQWSHIIYNEDEENQMISLAL